MENFHNIQDWNHRSAVRVPMIKVEVPTPKISVQGRIAKAQRSEYDF